MVQIEECLGVEALAALIMNFESNETEEYECFGCGTLMRQISVQIKEIGVGYEASRVSTRETIY